MGKISDGLLLVRKHYREARAEQKGEAISKARMIKQAQDVPELAQVMEQYQGRPRPIQNAIVRTLEGRPMVFFTDGSLRHVFGRKVSKAARKRLKRERQRANAAH